MLSESRTSLTNSELRGRTILGVTLAALTVFFLTPQFDGRLAAPSAWLEQLGGIVPGLLIVYFAFRGGRFSLSIMRFFLMFVGGVLAFVAAISLAAFFANKLSEINLFSARGIPLLIAYGLLAWVFFLSPSVRAYVQQRQTQGYRLSRVSG